MGYLAAVFHRHGRTVEMIDVRLGGERIARQLRVAASRWWSGSR